MRAPLGAPALWVLVAVLERSLILALPLHSAYRLRAGLLALAARTDAAFEEVCGRRQAKRLVVCGAPRRVAPPLLVQHDPPAKQLRAAFEEGVAVGAHAEVYGNLKVATLVEGEPAVALLAK